MNHWHCTKCHHEWDGAPGKCDWCGGEGRVIGHDPNFCKLWQARCKELTEKYADTYPPKTGK